MYYVSGLCISYSNFKLKKQNNQLLNLAEFVLKTDKHSSVQLAPYNTSPFMLTGPFIKINLFAPSDVQIVECRVYVATGYSNFLLPVVGFATGCSSS